MFRAKDPVERLRLLKLTSQYHFCKKYKDTYFNKMTYDYLVQINDFMTLNQKFYKEVYIEVFFRARIFNHIKKKI